MNNRDRISFKPSPCALTGANFGGINVGAAFWFNDRIWLKTNEESAICLLGFNGEEEEKKMKNGFSPKEQVLIQTEEQPSQPPS